MQLASLGSSLTVPDQGLLNPGVSPFAHAGGIGTESLAHWTGWTRMPQWRGQLQVGGNNGLGLHGSAKNIGSGTSPQTLLEYLEARAGGSVTERAANISQRGRIGALSGEQPIAYLAAIRNLLEHDEIGAARHALEAAPVQVTDWPMIRRLQKLLSPPRIAVSNRRDLDRTREYAWLREHGREYRGKWVALEDGNLAAAAHSLRELRALLSELKLARPPLIHRLP